MPRLLLILAGNEARGLACAWWFHAHQAQLHPLTIAATALLGLALAWALIWRDLVRPALLAGELRRRLAAHRASA